VVDLDPSRPGFNFVPVGALPVDIVTSPGGTATFVASAEAGKYAIYALPTRVVSNYIFHLAAPRLTDLAACALPSAPGAMMMLTEPFADGQSLPTRCQGEAQPGVDHPRGDFSKETLHPGSRKLLVTLPDTGDVAILDAQELVDRPAGSFRACNIERLVHLGIDLPAVLPQQRTPQGGWPPGVAEDGSVCALTQFPSATTGSGYVAHPTRLAHDPQSGLLYVADDQAPVIHVIDVTSPCRPTQREPLLPMSADDPWRVVTTRALSLSPTTTDGKRFLYAVDGREGSLMVFDVSLGSTDRTPLMRPYPDRNPYRPKDRLAFAVPVREVAFVSLDNPIGDAVSGSAPWGTQCDPDLLSGGLGVGYRTASDYSYGAGPKSLRGIFGAALLTSGQIAFIDVDDFDAPCRRPQQLGACPRETFGNYEAATGEVSCNVVERNDERNAAYMLTGQVSGARMPGLQAYPTLTLNNSVIPFGDAAPMLLAPAPAKADQKLVVQVGNQPADVIESDPATAAHHMVWFDFTEPRAHSDQSWTISYEGGIPGFGGRVARLLSATGTDNGQLEDAGAHFCDRGVHDLDAAILVANALGLSGSASDPSSQAYLWARGHMDVVQILDGFLDTDDPYWASVADRCDYQACRDTFGLPDAPKATRDFPILQAWQGKVTVSDPLQMASCCFPMLATYTVRALQQWVVVGAGTGFLHRGAADPNTGRCVDSCDPVLRLYNGRVLEQARAGAQIPTVGGPNVFRNPMMQFWIHPGQEPSVRDMYFSFNETGGFIPLLVNLAASTSYVQPQAMQFFPQLGQLVIIDGSVQGLMLVNLSQLTLSASYY
jgi:hypothetical protein